VCGFDMADVHCDSAGHVRVSSQRGHAQHSHRPGLALHPRTRTLAPPISPTHPHSLIDPSAHTPSPVYPQVNFSADLSTPLPTVQVRPCSRNLFWQLSLSFETISRDTRAFAMAHRAQVRKRVGKASLEGGKERKHRCCCSGRGIRYASIDETCTGTGTGAREEKLV
jgi:hypothetical protein